MCKKCHEELNKTIADREKRTPEMEKMVDDMAKIIFGRSPKDRACIICGNEKTNPEDFADDLSRKEFGISHMCQECQDLTFGK